MSATTNKLRKQVRAELLGGLQFIGRAANLLTQHDWHCEATTTANALGAAKAAEALEQITESVTDHINNLLTR